MLAKLETFLKSLTSGEADAAAKLEPDEVRVASAALLVHVARADGDQSARENTVMRDVLARRFELEGTDAETVITAASAEHDRAVDTHTFTRVLHENLDFDQRREIIRMLWEVADADGTIDSDEKNAVSLAATLLHVEPHEAVALRRDVASRRG